MLEAKHVLGIAASGLILSAGILFYRVRRFLARAESRVAEVVAVRPYAERSTQRYIQVFQFETAGRTVEAELKAGLPHQVGARIPVFFESTDPTRIRVKAELYRPVIVLLVFAGLVLLALIEALRG
jgi:hypothetical protein